MSADTNYDWRDPGDCAKFINDKAREYDLPSVRQSNVVTFLGPTSAGKTTLLNNLIGAYVLSAEPAKATPHPRIAMTVSEERFAKLCQESYVGAWEDRKHGAPGRLDETTTPAPAADKKAAASVAPKANQKALVGDRFLFPVPRPHHLTRTSDPHRYGRLYCLSDRSSDLMKELSLPQSLQADVIVVNSAELARHTPGEKESDFGNTAFLDTKGLDLTQLVDPDKGSNANVFGGLRDALHRSARIVCCLPQAIDDGHKRFLQILEDELLSAGGSKASPYAHGESGGAVGEVAQSAKQSFFGTSTQHNKFDGEANPWRSVLFSVSRMDQCHGSLSSFMNISHEIGAAFSALKYRPEPNRVRFVAMPSEMAPLLVPGAAHTIGGTAAALSDHEEDPSTRESLAVREYLTSNWAELRGELRQASSFDLCASAKQLWRHARERERKGFHWKKFVPSKAGANTDSYYLQERLAKAQKCPSWWE